MQTQTIILQENYCHEKYFSYNIMCICSNNYSHEMLYNCKNGEYAYTNTHNVILLIKFDELSQIRSTIPAADMLSPLPAIWMTWVQTRLGATQILLWSSPPPPHTHDGGRVDQWHTMASGLSTDKEWIVHHKTRSLCIDLLRSTNVAVSSERSLWQQHHACFT